MQTVFFTAYNLGFMLVAPYALPLVSYGNTVLCINALLVGLLCSVFRRGEGVRDKDLRRHKKRESMFLHSLSFFSSNKGLAERPRK